MHAAPRLHSPENNDPLLANNFSAALGVLLLFLHPRCSGGTRHNDKQLTFARRASAPPMKAVKERECRPPKRSNGPTFLPPRGPLQRQADEANPRNSATPITRLRNERRSSSPPQP